MKNMLTTSFLSLSTILCSPAHSDTTQKHHLPEECKIFSDSTKNIIVCPSGIPFENEDYRPKKGDIAYNYIDTTLSSTLNILDSYFTGRKISYKSLGENNYYVSSPNQNLNTCFTRNIEDDEGDSWELQTCILDIENILLKNNSTDRCSIQLKSGELFDNTLGISLGEYSWKEQQCLVEK